MELLKSCCVSIDGAIIIRQYLFIHKLICVHVTGDPKSNYEQDLSVVDEVLRMFLEILNAAFSHQLSSNQHLIYSMLHQKEVLDILRRQASFQDVVANLDTVRSRTFDHHLLQFTLFHSFPYSFLNNVGFKLLFIKNQPSG